jgi:purine nucleoside permease
MRRFVSAATLALLSASCTSPKNSPISVKVVVVTMFERGADTGDEPGEFQNWVEHEKLDQVIAFPQGFHDLRMNADGVLGTLTGVGTARAAASIMALGLDPRFDLTKAYWVVAGIAGVDPQDASLGSAAWAEWVVDADLAHEIDAREIPKDWKTGYVPLRKSVPYEQPRLPDAGGVFHLQPALVNWAVRLTRDVPLQDTEAMRTERLKFTSANARRPPFVLKGDTLSGSTFWHGKLLQPVGQRLGAISHRWPGQLCHYGDGGHRHSAVPPVSR